MGTLRVEDGPQCPRFVERSQRGRRQGLDMARWPFENSETALKDRRQEAQGPKRAQGHATCVEDKFQVVQDQAGTPWMEDGHWGHKKDLRWTLWVEDSIPERPTRIARKLLWRADESLGSQRTKRGTPVDRRQLLQGHKRIQKGAQGAKI